MIRLLVRNSLLLLATGIVLSIPFALGQSLKTTSFVLHDGETVVFYGDSITAQRFYTRFVEDFVLTRYPETTVRFVNAGVPGDTVFGGYAGAMPERVARDVAPFHPGMITVMLGMNDGGYGYTPTATVLENFDKGYTALLGALRKAAPAANFTIIRPTPYDEETHGTEFPGYAKIMDQVSDEVGVEAQKLRASMPGIYEVDFHTAIGDELKNAEAASPEMAQLIVPDRIHPAESGHWVMAAALMATWHANPVVSDVRLDALGAKTEKSERTAVSGVEKTGGGLRWTQRDEALPLPLDLNNAMTGVMLGASKLEKMDEETLQVDGLAKGMYELWIDAKPITYFTAEGLKHGVNLALLKTPMWEQARGIDYLEERRATLNQAAFLLRAEVKQTATTGSAEETLQEARAEMAASVREKLVLKPHLFELRLVREGR